MEKECRIENEKKKEYLNGYKYAVMAEKAIKEEIEQLRLSKMSPSFVMDGMPHGNGHSDLSSYAAKVDSLLEELKVSMNQRIDLRKEIVHKIEDMNDETEKLVLRYRYIHLLTWEDLAMEMVYSWQHIHKIHNKALKNFIL